MDPEPTFSPVAIGYVSTSFSDAEHTPVQSQRDGHAGRVHIHDSYVEGLDGLAGFDYVTLITHFDRPGPRSDSPERWRVEPFLLGGSGRRIGVFATRHPGRPNPIGCSLVRITETRASGFDFLGVDLLDNTPLLDVKPWVPELDQPTDPPDPIRTGWYQQPDVLPRQGSTPAQLRRPSVPFARDAEPDRS